MVEFTGGVEVFDLVEDGLANSGIWVVSGNALESWVVKGLVYRNAGAWVYYEHFLDEIFRLAGYIVPNWGFHGVFAVYYILEYVLYCLAIKRLLTA